jgi:hypothetical protein
MPIPTSTTSPIDDSEEARFHARMAKVSAGAGSRRSRRKDEEEEEKDGGFRLGWFGWLIVDALIVVGTVIAVLAWPPVEACRAQEKSVGFYAGDTVGKCIRRGIGERITNADQRMKMMLRGSGQ